MSGAPPSDQGWAIIPVFDVAMMLRGATPVKSLVDGVNMFIAPALPAKIGDAEEVTEALKHGSTVFLSQDFYDRLVAQHEARQQALTELGEEMDLHGEGTDPEETTDAAD